MNKLIIIKSILKESLVELMGNLLRSEYSEMTLMLGVYSHTNQMFEIVHLVRNILRIDIDIRMYLLIIMFIIIIFNFSHCI